MPARSSPSPFRISAIPAPTTKTWRASTRPPPPASAARSSPRPSPTRRAGRSSSHLDAWLKARGIVGITGIDTRALTALIRDHGMPNAVIANDPEGRFDREALKARAAALATDGGSRPRSAGHEPRDFRLVADDLGGEERLRQPPDRRGPQGRRHRLRGEAQHPAPARRGRLRRHRRACHHLRRRDHGDEARRRLPLERSRRSRPPPANTRSR